MNLKTYKFVCRSTRGGFKEYACAMDESGNEIKRINRDVTQETVTQFRTRVGAQLEAEGFVMAPHQYTL